MKWLVTQWYYVHIAQHKEWDIKDAQSISYSILLLWLCDRLYSLKTVGTAFSILHALWPCDLKAPPPRGSISLHSLWNWAGPQDSLVTNRIWWKWCCMTSEAGPEKAQLCQPWSPEILTYQLLHHRGLFLDPAVLSPSHMERPYAGTLVDSPGWAPCLRSFFIRASDNWMKTPLVHFSFCHV